MNHGCRVAEMKNKILIAIIISEAILVIFGLSRLYNIVANLHIIEENYACGYVQKV